MILVIDNYDSFTYNLVQLLGELRCEPLVVRNDKTTVDELKGCPGIEGIVISPGPGTPDKAGITEAVIREFSPSIPILGVCLGHQAIGEVFGAKVVKAESLLHGKTSRIAHDGKGVYRNVPQGFTAARYHSLALDRSAIPEELLVTAASEDGEVMGVRHRRYPVEGVQFHPESILTDAGRQILANFAGGGDTK